MNAFEEAWASHRGVPDLGAVLQSLGSAAGGSTAWELVGIDLEYRWKRWGESKPQHTDPDQFPKLALLDDYVQRFSSCLDWRQLPEDLVVDEYRLRLGSGEQPELADYAARFGEQFPALTRRLEEIRKTFQAESASETKSPKVSDTVLVAGGEESRSQETHIERVPSEVQSASGTGTNPNQFGSSLVGSRIGEYLLGESLGEGGMGTVYRAVHQKLKRTVAIKILKELSEYPEELIARFLREIELVGSLHHPNVITAFDAGEFRGVPYLVLEFVDGTDLGEYVKEHHPLELDEVVDLAIQAATGLAFAHDAGIIHRDIKPANFLIDSEGRIKLLDLGLARLSEQRGIPPGREVSEGLTQAGTVMGTVAYMAPEQASDIRTADHHADIYSLGCTLHFLLTGKAVYGGNSVVNQLMAHQQDPIPSLRESRSDVPSELDALFREMIAKSPKDRPGSMGDVVCRLKEIRDGISAMLSVPKVSGETVVTPGETTRNLTPRDDQPPRDRRWIIAAGAVLLPLLFWGIYTLTLKTPGGVLEITSQQSDLEVTVNGDRRIQLTDPVDGKPVTIDLPRGKHELRVTKNGFRTLTREFVLAADNPVERITVTLKPLKEPRSPNLTDRKSNPDSPPPIITETKPDLPQVTDQTTSRPNPATFSPTNDPGQQFAEFILSKGGSLTVAHGTENPLSVRSRRDLPSGPIKPLSATLSRVTLTADDTRGWVVLQDLMALDLGGCSITPESAKHIGTLQNLETLELSRSDFDDECAVALKSLKSLQRLDLGQTEVTETGLDHLAGLDRLITLELQLLPTTDDHLRFIGTFRGLTGLYLNGARITDRGVSELVNLQNLRTLDLSNTKIGDASIPMVSRLVGLESLTLSGTEVTDAGLAPLPNLKVLKTLSLRSCKLTGSHLDTLAKLPALQSLSLEFTRVTDENLVAVTALNDTLKSLYLSATPISDKSLPTLTTLTNIKILLVGQTELTPTAISELKKQLPNCTVVAN